MVEIVAGVGIIVPQSRRRSREIYRCCDTWKQHIKRRLSPRSGLLSLQARHRRQTQAPPSLSCSLSSHSYCFCLLYVDDFAASKFHLGRTWIRSPYCGPHAHTSAINGWMRSQSRDMLSTGRRRWSFVRKMAGLQKHNLLNEDSMD